MSDGGIGPGRAEEDRVRSRLRGALARAGIVAAWALPAVAIGLETAKRW